jgi:adenine-specific DNA-methyltransferase
MGKKDYKTWSKDELINEIAQLRKRKKYGLVWENKPEDVVEQSKLELPILEEVKTREITTDLEKPINLLIEGDNYHSLSVLNYTHKGKVDVIYIDPPYNTGAKNWKYNNDYIDKEDSYRHSKFISFMSSRFQLAKKLLSKSGIIICAIDDYEIHNVRHLMDEVFEENNRLGTIVVVHNPRGRNDDKFLATMHEYLLVYAKNKEKATVHHFELNEEAISKYNKKDDISFYNETSFIRTGNNSLREERPNLYYPIYFDIKKKTLSLNEKINSTKLLPINGKGEHRTWRWGKDTFIEKKETELFVKKVKNQFRIYKKRRLIDSQGTKPKTVWADSKYDASSNGIMLLQKMFSASNTFSYPKSIHAVEDILGITSNKNSLLLDFFAGSGTTGHAVLNLNKKDNGNRKFILCTNNENGISEEVCYPRIKKVIKGYVNSKKEKIEGLCGNLKYFKTDFVPATSTDKNKTKLTQKATEMLCVKEDTFEKVKSNKHYKIFRNKNRYTGIVYDHFMIDDFKKEIAKMDGKFRVYIFSLGDDTFDEEFADMKSKVKLSAIPEAILRVYRRIFK